MTRPLFKDSYYIHIVPLFNHDFVNARDARVSYQKVKFKDTEALMPRFLNLFD
jgi:hypothetical protein